MSLFRARVGDGYGYGDVGRRKMLGVFGEGKGKGREVLEGMCADWVPLLSTACHSSSLFWTGYDMFLSEAEVELELKREPRKGIVGMDFRIVPRAKGCSARARCAGRV